MTGVKAKNPQGAAAQREAVELGPAPITSVNDPKDAQFEIKVDGIVRTHRDVREYAIEAARELQKRNPNAKIEITDLRDGSTVLFDARTK